MIDFLVRACRQKIASLALFGQITNGFKTALRAWADAHGVPWVEFRKGERKDTVVQRYRDRFTKPSGVVLIGVAQERTSAWTATKLPQGRFVDFRYLRKSVCPNHYYVYLLDPECGPAFIKICGYAPYAIKLCLNGHEWAKRQLQRRRLRFTARDNGFLRCAQSESLQERSFRLHRTARSAKSSQISQSFLGPSFRSGEDGSPGAVQWRRSLDPTAALPEPTVA